MSKYELKDVIFGLRTEYLKLQDMLDEIRSMVELPDPRDSIDFQCYKDTKKNIIDLKLNILRKQSAIVKILQSIGRNVTNTDLEKRYPIHKLPNGGEHGLIIGDKKNIIIPEGNENDLFLEADRVLSSKLVNDTPTTINIYGELEQIKTRREISIFPIGINVHGWEKNGSYGNTPSEFLGYHADKDELNYSAYRDLAATPSLEDLLHLQIGENALTHYQKEVIERSNIRNREVILEPELYLVENTTYNIDDSQKDIILTRKK